MTTATVTHEGFIHGVRAIACERLVAADARERLLSTKLVYGSGHGQHARGVTYYGAWVNGHHGDLLEVCAFGEESVVQLAGTTIHELGHCLAGPGSGHGRDWRDACRLLGLVRAEAAGQRYAPDDFAPDLWAAVSALPEPSDGTPTAVRTPTGAVAPVIPRPCTLGIGTRGGTSRGPGSGSRLRKWTCQCAPAVIARVASDDFRATCGRCGAEFVRR